MADTKEKKGFKAGAYAVFAGVIVAVILVVLTIFTFTTRYNAFSPEKVAQSFTDTIVQTGDGYNSYKVTLVSKNQKFGTFVTNAYMLPYINKDAEQADFVGTGSDEEATAIDTVYDTMYDYYVELLNTYGLDDYDSIFSNYFAKLSEVRKEVYGDEYMDTDFMFGAFESNVETYGNSLTGTQRTFASDDKTITQEETIGSYQTMFGDDQEVEVEDLVDGKKTTVTETQPVYKLTSTVTNTQELTAEEVSEYLSAYNDRISAITSAVDTRVASFDLAEEDATKMADAFLKLDCSESIDAVDLCTVEVTTQNGDVVATQQVYVVQIGNSWYVDNTNVDTTGLYLAK
jgi:hypothetical protein